MVMATLQYRTSVMKPSGLDYRKNVRKGSAGIREEEDILRLRSKYIK